GRNAMRGGRCVRLPKERVLCSNLQTSFTDWPGLLAYLQEQAFDGYVALQRNGRYAWHFLALGNLDGVRQANEDGLVAGDEAIEAFKKMAEAPGGTMDVYRAPRAQMQLLGAEVEPIYNDLPSDFVEMGKMVAALARARHDGYIEVSLRGSRGMGYV